METSLSTSAAGARSRPRPRRGAAIIYGAVALTVLLALCSLAVDYGRAQLVRTELQSCADGCARAAASGIPISQGEARKRARDLAELNRADGAAVNLTGADFRFGKWNETTNQIDDASGPDVDAVEVTARRTVTLFFGAMFGKSSVDVVARATGRTSAAGDSVTGMVGLNGIQFNNSSFIGSYRTSVTTNPTPASSTGEGRLSSNTNIDFDNPSTINGDVWLGPGATLTGIVVFSGSITNLSDAMAAPADPAWTPAANPNGVPQSYTVNSDTTLPGGTYWFTYLNLNKKLTFSGPATLYVNGNIRTDDSLVTYQSIPSNLKIYQLGSNRTIDIQKDLTLNAVIQAPGSALIANNKLYWRGNGIVKSILAKNESQFFFDEDSASTSDGSPTLVQ